ncbi:DEAD/DEAH box helicase [Fulvitalea axinellae]|uniref:RNA helicase n=1 Tax=Fulvitalea axinellae TaxID=1182444 RepID=A0AAU9CC15_9BACT|nr:DEAD/DEAH box helicase [Fulvitalea axinellae]
MKEIETLGLSEEITKGIVELGFEEPTEIQSKVIPLLLEEDRDLIALSQTGTGKTAAYGLPIIHKTEVNEGHIQTLVLSPTRELCLQIANNLEMYAKYVRGVNVVAVYGGASITGQISLLRKRPQIVVATPGRMLDLIRRKKIDLSNVSRVVLDEADEMLDMGFKDELDAILDSTPDERTTILFSATMSPEAERISKRYMSEPVKVSVGRRNAGNRDVTHQCYVVRRDDRYAALKRMMDMHPDIYGIIFCRTRRETKEIADQLLGDGYTADALHGDMTQSQRDAVMGRFRVKSLNMLVATDVAARGLDVESLTHVIHYGLPDDTENYTHRSGRTGRAGKQGQSVSIIGKGDLRRIRFIEKMINQKIERVPVPDAKTVCEKRVGNYLQHLIELDTENTPAEEVMALAVERLQELDKDELIKKLVASKFSDFFTYYQNAKDLNVSGRDSDGRGRDRDRGYDRNDRRGDRRERGGDRVRYSRFKINVGKRDGVNPLKVIDLVNEVSPHMNVEIGKIDIMSSETYFDVDQNFKDHIMGAFKGSQFEGQSLSISEEKERRSFRGGNGGGRGGFNRRDNNRRDDRRSNYNSRPRRSYRS